MINIVVSGKERTVEETTTVQELLRLENVEMPEYVSVSINTEFVLQKDYTTWLLREGDVVEFLYYMGGGK